MAPGNPNLWRNDVSGFWSIVDEPSLQAVRTGFWSAAAWGDYDNDGDVDLFIVPGSDENQLHRNRLFRNEGAAGFVEVLEGKPVTDEASGTNWSSAHCFWVDYDNDGDLDLYVSVNGWTNNSNLLYRNNGNANHWLKVALTGRISNRSAIGAKVRVKAVIGGSEVWQLRVISAQAWTQELVAHFGLGDAAKVDTLRIEWPSGIVQELKDVDAESTTRSRRVSGVVD
jgi:enediyne biosynthesis protein E4